MIWLYLNIVFIIIKIIQKIIIQSYIYKFYIIISIVGLFYYLIYPLVLFLNFLLNAACIKYKSHFSIATIYQLFDSHIYLI